MTDSLQKLIGLLRCSQRSDLVGKQWVGWDGVGQVCPGYPGSSAARAPTRDPIKL